MKKRDAITRLIEQIRTYYDPDAIADAAGIHRNTVRRWLRGAHKPSVQSLYRVADVLGYRVTLTLRRK